MLDSNENPKRQAIKDLVPAIASSSASSPFHGTYRLPARQTYAPSCPDSWDRLIAEIEDDDGGDDDEDYEEEEEEEEEEEQEEEEQEEEQEVDAGCNVFRPQSTKISVPMTATTDTVVVIASSYFPLSPDG
nr:unnamed protein product [Spirometra erinaceieuropaei]